MNSSMDILFEEWLRYADDAKKTGDRSLYEYFLNEVIKTFMKLYAEAEMPESVSFIETVLKIASCELRGSSIKCKEDKVLF